jgi:CheY-like chemotaxis protein/c-di-GMP-binding flagellar brake protein YcgR
LNLKRPEKTTMISSYEQALSRSGNNTATGFDSFVRNLIGIMICVEIAQDSCNACTDATLRLVADHGETHMEYQQSILVLDDEPNFRRILEAKLRKSSFDVTTASSAKEALAHILIKPFDLFLFDLRLPDADGIDLIPRLRAIAPNTPILLMTAYEVEGLRDEVRNAGAVDVLYKPFDLSTLASTVQQILDSKPAEDKVVLTGSPLVIGQAITLQFPGGSPSEELAATILKSEQDTFGVAVATPIDLERGVAVNVSVAGGDALYEFHSSVATPTHEAVVSLVKPTIIHRNQRRQFPRPILKQRVFIIRYAGTSEDVYTGIGIDISEGGLCVGLSRPIAVGERVSIMLESAREGENTFHADAEVIHSETINGTIPTTLYRIGLRFTNIIEGAFSNISDLSGISR